MHLASTFLGKHCTHRIKGTLRSLHVVIHSRKLMCMGSHSGKIQWKNGVYVPHLSRMGMAEGYWTSGC